MSDLISRQAAIDAMFALCDTGETLTENKWRDNPHIDAITEELEMLPSVTPERKKGEWIHDEDWECNQCGKHFINVDEDEYGVPHFDFCPNCGCEMGVV